MNIETAIAANRNPPPNARIAGIAMALASLLSVALMMRHPSLGSHSIAEVVDEIGAKAMPSRVVHGALIALIGTLIYAFIEFSQRLGSKRLPVRAGLVAYLMGSGTMIGAALISGFLVPDLAATFARGRAEDLDAFRNLLTLCSLGNRTLANCGVIAMSAGILLWSIALLSSHRRHVRIGVLGLVAGAAPAGALLLGLFRLDVLGMTLVVVCQTPWNLAVGVALARGKL
jgi:hypothetical protein